MYHCEKCGEIVSDITKPCPTCGMFINQSYNYNQNLYQPNTSKKKITLIFIIGFLFIGLGTFLSVFESFSNDSSMFEGNGYNVEYLNSTWKKYENSDDEIFILSYKNTSSYLIFPSEIINYSIDLENEDARNYLHNTYLIQLNNSTNLSYHNTMANLEKIYGTNLYYLSSDFYSMSKEKYTGRTYFVHTVDGKCLTFTLVTSDKNIKDIEKDIFKLFKKIEI